ncbi:MAG TPA: PPOX class F420-dependent oxidoreductase [Ktedonobacteraceae bacterium]|nr:PPOX class F420-dependent oxidoreductase [Ktedonobacteraceae bacterium]
MSNQSENTSGQLSLTGLTLRVQDLERSLEFYKKLPGVEVVVHRPNYFAMLRVGTGRLGLLQQGSVPFHLELETSIDLETLHHELQQAGIEHMKLPAQKSWGEYNFTVQDPDGHVLEFESVQQESEEEAAQATDASNTPAKASKGAFTEKEIAYLQSRPLGRLATLNRQGELHVVPVRFIYNAELGTIDVGGVRGTFGSSRKFHDVAQTGRASLVADDILPPHHLIGIEIRGRAEAHPTGGEQLQPGGDPAFIRIWPIHIVSWGIEQEDYHPYSRKVG